MNIYLQIAYTYVTYSKNIWQFAKILLNFDGFISKILNYAHLEAEYSGTISFLFI